MLNGLSNSIELKENNPWELSLCSLERYRFLGSGIKALLSWNVYSLEEPLGANLTLFSSPLVTHLLAGDVVSGMHGRLVRFKDQTHARPFRRDRQWTSRLSCPSAKPPLNPAMHHTGRGDAAVNQGQAHAVAAPDLLKNKCDHTHSPLLEERRKQCIHITERDRQKLTEREESVTESVNKSRRRCCQFKLRPLRDTPPQHSGRWVKHRTHFPMQSAHADVFCQI